MIDFRHSENSVKFPARFVIPSYQRGYRWHQEDAEKLLQDLSNHTGCTYCLQPLELQYLAKKDLPKWIQEKEDYSKYEYYRVIDGQQRLTTVSIIAHILECSFPWDICYDTEQTLLSKMLPCELEKTINDYFRKQVYKGSETFIKQEEARKKILLNYFNEKRFERKIVFPVHFLPNDSSHDPEGQNAFTRLNAGKTPLTSSELIRALYMVSDNHLTDEQRTEISKEWELIESTLHDEQYWQMFNTKSMSDIPTRIDLLFALVLYGSSKLEWDSIMPNPRSIFEKMETGYYHWEIDLLKIWHEVVRCFWWIQSCYSDIETYNYMGWIALCTVYKPSTIYHAFLNAPSKEDFKKALIGIIHENGICNIPQEYGNRNLKNLLLLFNILECNNSQERFRFDLLESYDVEHIDSQTPNDLSKEPISKVLALVC